MPLLASRAFIQFILPTRVLISPLWAIMRIGWAKGHLGLVFVLNLLWQITNLEVYRGS